MPGPQKVVRLGGLEAAVRRDLSMADLLRVLAELRADIAGAPPPRA